VVFVTLALIGCGEATGAPYSHKSGADVENSGDGGGPGAIV
jgi:hypothetical protein